MKRPARLGLALAVATAIWVPLVHFAFAPRGSLRAERGEALAREQVRLWTDPELRAREVSRMRETNNEWDFMGRTFLAWSLAEIAAADSNARATNLAAIDRILDETLALE